MTALADRFWAKVDVGEPWACWAWKAHTDANGYGRIAVAHGEPGYAHRVAFELTYGFPPPVVAHRCDVKACCNPGHLFPGTQADNIADMVAKGRSAGGERNARAVLTAREAAAIRILAGAGIPYDLICRAFRTTKSNVSMIRRGRRWERALGVTS